MKNLKTNNFVTMKKFYLFFSLMFVFAVQAQEMPPRESSSQNQPKVKSSGFDKTKLVKGLGLQLGGTQGGINLGLNPYLGYQLTENLTLGATVGYNYFNSSYGDNSFFSVGPQLRFEPIRNISLISQYQYNVGRNDFRQNGERSENQVLYLGAGYRSALFNVGLMYDVLYNQDRSFQNSPFVPYVSMGF
ncbi:MAG: hypothetical protein C4K58_00180 [Flavobacteriaceae bacterium]|nr:MAG: hypothetical protein C4K58_00180 [Flavobacteriaceae bacterium]